MAAVPDAPLPLRYRDREFGMDAVKILPGQYHAARGDVAITTVLGSCVSTCLWDPASRIGGMNHFMLPGDAPGADSPWADSARYGVYAMEVLINDMTKMGADRRRLVAKVFGGAQLLAGFGRLDVGAKNSEFVLQFLRTEGIQVLAQDLQDVCPRRVHFFVASGKVQVKRLSIAPSQTVQQREREYLRRLTPRGGEIEIFQPPK